MKYQTMGYGSTQPAEIDHIHLRRGKEIACGASHVDARRIGLQCCRLTPTEVTCSACKQADAVGAS